MKEKPSANRVVKRKETKWKIPKTFELMGKTITVRCIMGGN